MTDRRPTFAEACRDLRNAFQAVVNIYAHALIALLPALPILLRLTARVVFYVPEKWYLRLLYALVASGLAAAFLTALATGVLLRH